MEDGECVPDEIISICGEGCLDCANDTFCNECADDYYRIVFDNNNTARCVDECPEGYAPDSNNECSVLVIPVCGDNCDSCTNDTYCDDCASGYYRWIEGDTAECVDSCPVGYEPNLDNDCIKVTVDCGKHCSDCENDTYCNACKPNYYRFVDDDTAKCVSRCPDGYHADENNECIEDIVSICGEGCLNCANDTYCNECSSGYFRVIEGDEAHCADSCPEGYEPNEENDCVEVIEICGEHCTDCDSETHCNTCEEGYYRHVEGDEAHCVETCPEGYQPNESGDCEEVPTSQCSEGCLTCDSETYCTECDSGYFRLIVDEDTATCVTSCPTGYI